MKRIREKAAEAAETEGPAKPDFDFLIATAAGRPALVLNAKQVVALGLWPSSPRKQGKRVKR